MIGDDGISDLRILEEFRDQLPQLKNYSPFRTRSKVIGLLSMPLAKDNYLKDIKTVMSNVSSSEQLFRRYKVFYRR